MHRHCGRTFHGGVLYLYVDKRTDRSPRVGPFTGSSFDLTIADGKIQQLTKKFDFGDFSTQVWDPLRSWMRANHGDDYDTMFTVSEGIELPSITPEALELWRQHNAEFVASLE